MRKSSLFWALAMLCLSSSRVFAAAEEDDLALVYGDKAYVSVASGSAQPLARAPSVATVITATDIEAMGARDLDEVLAQVPGMHVSRSFTAYNPIYSFRGVHTQYNAQVLMLINGVPMTSVFLGDRGNIWGGMPAANIARIEVIRGPGSALYGADALTGVINVFTKNAAEIGGTKVVADYGSFNTSNLSLLHGTVTDKYEIAAFLRIGQTDGLNRTIEKDAQTGLDGLFGTHASKAPGSLDLGLKAIDADLSLKAGRLELHNAYKKRSDVESGSGVADALDPTGRSSTERITSELTWYDPKLTDKLDFKLQASYYHLNERSDLVLFPAGAFGGAFPDGMLGNPYKWERHVGLSATTLYSGWQNHRLRAGVGWQRLEIYKIRESKNYTFVATPAGPAPAPLGSLVDVSDTAPFQTPHTRILTYGFLQDEWQLAPDWALTAGVRHDRYSDFGSTTNPRAALVWEAAYNVTAKLMFGQAFRAPSFAELYNINNPVAMGNRSLKPEKIRTSEAAVTWQAMPKLGFGANVYQFRMTDILRFVANANPATGKTAQNAGSLKGAGFELEATWDAAPNLRVSGHYARQRIWDPVTSEDPGGAPGQTAYARADWRFASGWTLTPQFNWVADRHRESGDTRPPVKDYALMDLALRYANPGRTWSCVLAIKNLFDADAREPSPAPGSIANDFPLAGRTVMLQGSFSF